MTAPAPVSHGLIDYGRLVVFGGAALLAGVACAGWLDGQRGEALPGLLQTKTVSIAAGRPSRVAELLVQTGQSVEPNLPLVRLLDERLEARLTHQERELAELRAEVDRANAAAEVELGWRRRELQAEMFDTRMRLATLQNERLNRQVEQIAWREHLTGTPQWTGSSASDPILRPITLSSPTTSVDRLQAVLKEDAAALAAESLTAQIALCDRRLADLASLEQRLEANVRLSAGVEVAERRLAAAEAELTTLRDQRKQLTIRSGGYGLVGAIHRRPGDVLSAGDAILDLLDDEQRTVLVRVPTRQLGRIQSGSRVSLKFPDHVRREGIVGPIPPHAVFDRASTTDETELQIPILPAGKLWPKIPTGTRVDVALLRG